MKKVLLFILFSLAFCVICFCQQRPLTASETRILSAHKRKVDSMTKLYVAARLKLEKARKTNPKMIDPKIVQEYTWREQIRDAVIKRMVKTSDSISRKRTIRGEYQ